MGKEYIVEKIDENWFKMITVDEETKESSIATIRKETVKQIYNSLKEQKERIIATIVEKEKSHKDMDYIEGQYGGKYTETQVKEFLELAKLTEARTNVEGIKAQLEASRNMVYIINDQLIKIEAVILELKRTKK